MSYFFRNEQKPCMPCCKIVDRAQMSKTIIIVVKHFTLGGQRSLETAVNVAIETFDKFVVTYFVTELNV